METVYCKAKDINKHKIVKDFPNSIIKECKDKDGFLYRLHIIKPENKINVKVLTRSEIEWFCLSKDGKLFITGVTLLQIDWFPKELICGIINGRYNCNS